MCTNLNHYRIRFSIDPGYLSQPIRFVVLLFPQFGHEVVRQHPPKCIKPVPKHPLKPQLVHWLRDKSLPANVLFNPQFGQLDIRSAIVSNLCVTNFIFYFVSAIFLTSKSIVSRNLQFSKLHLLLLGYSDLSCSQNHFRLG